MTERAWPRYDEVRSSGWSGAEEEIEPEQVPIVPECRNNPKDLNA